MHASLPKQIMHTFLSCTHSLHVRILTKSSSLIPCHLRCRGKFRSKPWQQLLEEAKYLVESGVKELNLIAEDTNQYGQDRRDGKGLAQLMHELGKLEGLRWMRILYAYPSYFTDDLVEEIATNSKVRPVKKCCLAHQDSMCPHDFCKSCPGLLVFGATCCLCVQLLILHPCSCSDSIAGVFLGLCQCYPWVYLGPCEDSHKAAMLTCKTFRSLCMPITFHARIVCPKSGNLHWMLENREFVACRCASTLTFPCSTSTI